MLQSSAHQLSITVLGATLVQQIKITTHRHSKPGALQVLKQNQRSLGGWRGAGGSWVLGRDEILIAQVEKPLQNPINGKEKAIHPSH